jgi:hypothetical protein
MNRHSLCLVISAAALAGFLGTARAELNESPAVQPPVSPAVQPSVKADRPVPLPRPHPVVASRRASPDQSAAAVAPQPQPICAWVACDQYLIVGIGF